MNVASAKIAVSFLFGIYFLGKALSALLG